MTAGCICAWETLPARPREIREDIFDLERRPVLLLWLVEQVLFCDTRVFWNLRFEETGESAMPVVCSKFSFSSVFLWCERSFRESEDYNFGFFDAVSLDSYFCGV